MISAAVHRFLQIKGARFRRAPPYKPSLNGQIERGARHVKEKERIQSAALRVPHNFFD